MSNQIHPLAKAEFDAGAVPDSRVLNHLTITMRRSAEQQAALAALLREQMDPGSANYHKWLTPEEFAERFGLSDADASKLQSWLGGEGFTGVSVSRAKNAISFDGTAGEIRQAFQTSLHYYKVNGVVHFANASAPSVPAAFAGVVGHVHGLNDFRANPRRLRVRSTAAPHENSGNGEHSLAPGDIATIYDIAPIYSGGNIGSGQSLAVVGQTEIRVSDLEEFRTYFGLSGSDPQITLVPNTEDPGVSNDDLLEADLDLELSAAIAPAATVTYVYSSAVFDALTYAIDQDIAPVISMSYGYCEADTTASDADTLQGYAQQANAQGITWFAASGDDGGADCAGDGSGNNGYSVDLPGSIPEVTSMGGTEFAEGSGSYWAGSNRANKSSALSYIPEVAWNDSAEDGEPSASGGGASVFFGKPTWQTGTGVPNDAARDVPDVSLSASADHDGYQVYSGGQWSVLGGTSAPAPIFAGIAALLNGALGSGGLGNINPVLYALASSTSGVFHDVTQGNNEVTESCGHRQTCSSTAIGFAAGVGYDEVTGLGSVDVAKLFAAWPASSSVATESAPPVILAAVNGASYKSVYAPGEFISVFGTDLAPSAEAAAGVPLPDTLDKVSAKINGVAAPFYYVSPKQVNLQIPYEIAAGTPAVLTINNGDLSGTFAFTIAAAGPGIFTGSTGLVAPASTFERGKPATLYLTGEGAVSPTVATGMAPASTVGVDNLPKPVLPVTVTVAGVSSTIIFVGNPWLVGVSQINFEVPSSVPTGTQEVVVTVGGVASQAAKAMIE